MTPLTGWIKFHRKTMEGPVWDLSPPQYKVWDACLLLANNKPRKWFDGTREIVIPRGSFVTTERGLAEKVKVSRIVIRRALTGLERIGSIRAQRRAQKYTVIEVVNFDSYQGSDRMVSPELSPERAQFEPIREKERSKEEERTPPQPFNEQAFWEKFPPHNQEVIRQTIEAIHSTRKKGRVADSVIQTELRWWSQRDPAQVIAGMQTYLQKGYAAQGRQEEYLRGIIRKSDGQTPQSVSSREVGESPGQRAIRRAAMGMTIEDCSE